jgi:HSP20 family protein
MPNLRIWSEREISRLRNEMDRMFDAFCLDLGLQPRGGMVEPSVDVRERDVVVRIKLPPGLRPEDLEVRVEERSMTITCTKVQEVRGGQSSQTVRRTITLPCRVEADQASAVFDEGELTVTMPKSEQGRATIVPITQE